MFAKQSILGLMLIFLLPRFIFAVDAPPGLESVPSYMIHESVLSEPNGKFEIGIKSLKIQWYRSTQTKYPTYAAINQTAHRVYTVAYFRKENGDTMEKTVDGAYEGIRRWASKNNAVVQKTSSQSSNIPLSNS